MCNCFQSGATISNLARPGKRLTQGKVMNTTKQILGVLFKGLVFGVVLTQDCGASAKVPGTGTSDSGTYSLPSPKATIQQEMRLRCRFVAETTLNRKNGTLDGNVSTKIEKQGFQFSVLEGRLTLVGTVGFDRLRAIANVPGDSAYFVEDTAFGNIALWSFHRVEADLILAVKQVSVRDLDVSDIHILSTAANCEVKGGNGIAVIE